MPGRGSHGRFLPASAPWPIREYPRLIRGSRGSHKHGKLSFPPITHHSGLPHSASSHQILLGGLSPVGNTIFSITRHPLLPHGYFFLITRHPSLATAPPSIKYCWEDCRLWEILFFPSRVIPCFPTAPPPIKYCPEDCPLWEILFFPSSTFPWFLRGLPLDWAVPPLVRATLPLMLLVS